MDMQVGYLFHFYNGLPKNSQNQFSINSGSILIDNISNYSKKNIKKKLFGGIYEE